MRSLIITLLFLSAITFCFAGDLSPHFSREEFRCKCCGKFAIEPDLIDALEELRYYIGDKSITINSGYRCPQHNKAVGGAKASQHILGKAADISVKWTKEFTVDDLYQAARYIDRFGFIKKYSTWVHVDVRR